MTTRRGFLRTLLGGVAVAVAMPLLPPIIPETKRIGVAGYHMGGFFGKTYVGVDMGIGDGDFVMEIARVTAWKSTEWFTAKTAGIRSWAAEAKDRYILFYDKFDPRKVHLESGDHPRRPRSDIDVRRLRDVQES